MIKPIINYTIQLWDCVYKSNIDALQSTIGTIIKTSPFRQLGIAAAYRFERHNAIHHDIVAKLAGRYPNV